MRVGSLRDGVFLLAHGDDGRLMVSEPVICAGLAGAILVDLLLSERVAVAEGRLAVVDPSATGDALADATLEAIAANDAPTGPRAWVAWISDGAYERTADALEAAGVIARTTVRRLGLLPVSRCVPTDEDDLVRLRSRLRYGAHSSAVPDLATAALAGLVRALRLESALLLSMPRDDLLHELERMSRASPTTVRQVISAVDGVISAATYR
jgi:hypothetical protein